MDRDREGDRERGLQTKTVRDREKKARVGQKKRDRRMEKR